MTKINQLSKYQLVHTAIGRVNKFSSDIVRFLERNGKSKGPIFLQGGKLDASIRSLKQDELLLRCDDPEIEKITLDEFKVLIGKTISNVKHFMDMIMKSKRIEIKGKNEELQKGGIVELNRLTLALTDATAYLEKCFNEMLVEAEQV